MAPPIYSKLKLEALKIIENTLWIEYADFLSAGWKEDTLKKANLRNGPFWMMTADPLDKRKPLVKFETLRDEHKAKLNEYFGDVHSYMAKAPIKALVKIDHKAHEFFLSYRYDSNKTLPSEHITKYTTAANWLNMLNQVNADKRIMKKQLNLSLAAFWMHVCDIIKADKIDLPTSYQRLITKMAEYQEKGYECLVDWRFGNKLAAKVKDEVSESVLLELIAHPNQHDDVIIAKAYNEWAMKNEYRTIDPATVGNHRRKNNHLLQGQREGVAAWYNTYGKIIHRNRPSAPLLLIGSDDNDLDLYFRDERRGKTNHYFRYKLIVIMDAHNDYILGYSYGETVTVDLVKAAYLDAMHHIKFLTGGWYLMDQIQTDHWAIKALEPFYSSLATFTPATAKVARAKYIERAFGSTWHQMLKLYPNYAGTNITSKGRINRDNLEIQKRDFPTFAEGAQYIDDFITRMRMIPDAKTGKPKQQMWLDAFHRSELSQQHQISDARMLYLLGQQHTHTHTITNGGLKVTFDGSLHTYDIPDELYLENVGKKVQVIYDPYDKNKVLVTDGGKLRFVAKEFDKMSSAIADYKEGDRARLNYLLDQKRKHVETISAKKETRQTLVERHAIDSASLLQAQVLTKEIKQTAELDYQRASLGDNYDPLDQM